MVLLSGQVSRSVSTVDSANGLEPSTSSAEATRRTLSARQQATLTKLIAATVEELREGGFDNLSVRSVAARAGVAPATAYNYFSSREHLVAEVFWRRLVDLETAEPDNTTARRKDSVAKNVAATLESFALLVADEPELAAACTVAMLSTEQDVKLLRDRIGIEMNRRLRVAMGPDPDPDALGVLEFVISGAMLQAGMGHLSYTALVDRFDTAVRLVMTK